MMQFVLIILKDENICRCGAYSVFNGTSQYKEFIIMLTGCVAGVNGEGYMEKEAVLSGRSGIRLTMPDAGGVILSLLGFFIGRVIFFQFLSPVAAAYSAVFIGSSYQMYTTALFTALGLATKLKGVYLLKYIVYLILTCTTHFIICRKKIKTKVIVQSACGGVCAFISGMLPAAVNGFGFYFILMALFEGILALCLTFVLKRSAALMSVKRRKTVLDNDEIISMAILLGCIIAGASDIYIGNISLKYFFSAWVLIAVSYKGGSSMGAACGVLLGLMLFLAGFWDVSLPGILGVCGVVAGFFKNSKKIYASVAFMVSGFIAVYYMNSYIMTLELIFSVSFALLLFLLTPDRLYFSFMSAINPVLDNSQEYISRIKEGTTQKLMAFSNAFEKLSLSFNNISQKKSTMDKKDVSRLIDDLAEKACSGCERKGYCWDDNFYATYQTVFAMLDDYEKKGWIETENKKCVDRERFYGTASRLFEIYNNNLTWDNKITESRELVSQQLMGVSGIIKGLAEELDMDVKFNEGMEENIAAELSRNRIEVDSVIVLENNLGKYEVTLKQKACYGKKKCLAGIIPIINSVLKRKMKPEDEMCYTKKGVCSLRLVEEKRYRISSGIAKLSKGKKGESGDSYSFMELKNGKCMLALSDGMGSGSRAREESAATMELLEDFIESGFEKELAVKIINSVLVLKSNDETFSTLDICSIDLYSGDSEFIKIGAASTFLLRDGRVSIIKSSSLPMGMLDYVDVEVSIKKLKHNDVIIMVTDGLTEIDGTKDNWLVDTLLKSTYSNPQDLADYIILEAENKSSGAINDDMTVLAARLWEKK